MVPRVVTCLSSERAQLAGDTPTTLGTQTNSTHSGASNGRCVLHPSHGVLFSPGGWGLWSSGSERCLQEQALREAGLWWGQAVQPWVLLVPRAGVLVGMWLKPWDTAGHSKTRKNACKFATSITLPSLCSSNLLQTTSNVPNNFSKILLAWAKLQLLRKRTCPQEGSRKNTINYKCLSVIRKLSWPVNDRLFKPSTSKSQ